MEKIVDIVISKDSLVIVQIEVESGSRESTIEKLAFGLADQLRYLNNCRDSDVTSFYGFYVPVGCGGYVEKVKCTWSDESVVFLVESEPIARDRVFEEIQSAVSYAVDLTPGQTSREFMMFFLLKHIVMLYSKENDTSPWDPISKEELMALSV